MNHSLGRLIDHVEKKEKKLEQLVGDLKDDKEFIEFLEANKAIKSKENIWKNDISLNILYIVFFFHIMMKFSQNK